MRILTVSNMYPSERDKVYGTFVRNFVNQVAERNPGGVNDICVIKGKRTSKAGKATAYASFYPRLLWRLLFGRYDVIYVHTITFPIIPLRVAMALRWGLPVVFNVHGDDVLPSNRLKRALKRMAAPVLPSARLIVCPTAYFRSVVLREFQRVSPDKVFISPSGGVGGQFFTPHTGPGGGKPLTLGYVSRIDEGKGWENFVEAIAALRARGMDCRGVMAGRGAQAPLLGQMIAGMGLQGVIDYVGPVPQDRLPELYASFDLFVFPSVRAAESLGLVGLEAMAAGTPVAGCNMAGPAEYIVDGKNGYLYEPGSTEALVEAISRYVALDAPARAAMQEAAAATAARYHAGDVADALCRKVFSLIKA